MSYFFAQPISIPVSLATAEQFVDSGNIWAAEQNYQKLWQDFKRPDVASAYGRFLLLHDRPLESLRLFEWLWDFGQSTADEESQQIAALGLCHAHRELNQFSESSLWLDAALDLPTTTERTDQTSASPISSTGISISSPKDGRELTAEELGALANEALTAGEDLRAEQLLLRSLRLERDAGNVSGVAADLGSLGVVALLRGHHAEALRFFWSAFRIHRRLNDLRSVGDDLANMAELARRMHRWDAAARLLRRAENCYASGGCFSRRAKAMGRRQEAVAIGGVLRRDPNCN